MGHPVHSAYIAHTREFVLVENIRLVCLLDLTADFGVKTNEKLIVSCERRAKLEFKAVCTQTP